MLWLKLGAGFIGSSVIAGVAYRNHSLSAEGAAAAVVIGTALTAAQEAAWFLTMIAFFVSSSVWSRLGKKSKQAAAQGYEKGDRRDAGQVFANGGLATAIALAAAFMPEAWAEGWSWAFAGAMAAVTADTWATEIGGWSRSQPRSIVTGRRVEPGTSGGVTPLGLAAAASGAIFIGLVFGGLQWAFGGQAADLVLALAAGLVGGVAGSLADSWVGAVWQRMNRCGVCGCDVEAVSHCGRPTRYVRGARYMNNDAVNAICSAVGALTGAIAAWAAAVISG